MVKIGSGTRPATLSNHTQADHGGAGGTLPCRIPHGRKYPTSVPPSQIDDSVPTEEEVKWVVRMLHSTGREDPNRCASSTFGSGCRSIGRLKRRREKRQRESCQIHKGGREGLRTGESTGVEGREQTKWEMVVELLQTDFRDRVLTEEAH